MAKKTSAKPVNVELVQVTVRFLKGGQMEFDYKIVADRAFDTRPSRAEFRSPIHDLCDSRDPKLLFDTLRKIRQAYCRGKLALCVKGKRIVDDQECGD